MRIPECIRVTILMLLAAVPRIAQTSDGTLFEADANTLRVALVLPNGYAVGMKGANLSFTLAEGMQNTHAPTSFRLTERTSTGTPAGIREPAPGFRIHEYAVVEKNLSALSALLKEIGAYRRSHPEAKGLALSVDADVCRQTHAHAGPALLSIYFRYGSADAYEALQQDIELDGDAEMDCP